MERSGLLTQYMGTVSVKAPMSSPWTLFLLDYLRHLCKLSQPSIGFGQVCKNVGSAKTFITVSG